MNQTFFFSFDPETRTVTPEEGQVNYDAWWSEVDPSVRTRSVRAIQDEFARNPEFEEAAREQGFAGVAHFGLGMLARNVLRGAGIADAELPARDDYYGEGTNVRNWDDYYVQAVEEALEAPSGEEVVPDPETLYVHFYGGPGTGKSTTRALVFGALKQLGYNVEETPEFAKDLTWENRSLALGFQPYIFGKQAYKEHRLDGQVEAVLSDTSPLLSLIYSPDPQPSWWAAFEEFVVDYYESRRTLNIVLERDPSRPYNPKGRNQTEEEAEAFDDQIKDMLYENALDYIVFTVDRENSSHVDEIVTVIQEQLDD